jgi:hypothetical protein
MSLICYAFENNNHELEAPFLEFLGEYAIEKGDSGAQRELKVKRLMNIKAHLNYLLENEGRYNLAPLVQKYHGRNFGILKIKEAERLIRIAFYTPNPQTIVLLNVMVKPKRYEKRMKLKVDKQINSFLNKSHLYLHDFTKNKCFINLTL